MVSVGIIPLFFYISSLQATKLKGFRRKMRGFRETRNNGIIDLINSITVIKSFTREDLESKKHEGIQLNMTENQLKTRQLSFLFNGVKVFIEQFAVVIDRGLGFPPVIPQQQVIYEYHQKSQQHDRR